MQDSSYIRGLVLAGAKYLFVDFCGMVLFRALGTGFYEKANILLNTKLLKLMFMNRNLKPLYQVIKTDDYDQTDFVAVLWALYNYCLEKLLNKAARGNNSSKRR